MQCIGKGESGLYNTLENPRKLGQMTVEMAIGTHLWPDCTNQGRSIYIGLVHFYVEGFQIYRNLYDYYYKIKKYR